MTGGSMTAEDVFRLRGLAVFVDALVRHDAMTRQEAAAMPEAGEDGLDCARRLSQRVIDLLGDGSDGEGWFKYEISEIGYNVDVTAYGYGDAALAKRWEVLNEEDNSFAYVTRLGTMDALACGLLGTDGPGARFTELIARLDADRRRDAELKARMRAAWAARNPRR